MNNLLCPVLGKLGICLYPHAPGVIGRNNLRNRNHFILSMGACVAPEFNKHLMRELELLKRKAGCFVVQISLCWACGGDCHVDPLVGEKAS